MTFSVPTVPSTKAIAIQKSSKPYRIRQRPFVLRREHSTTTSSESTKNTSPSCLALTKFSQWTLVGVIDPSTGSPRWSTYESITIEKDWVDSHPLGPFTSVNWSKLTSWPVKWRWQLTMSRDITDKIQYSESCSIYLFERLNTTKS